MSRIVRALKANILLGPIGVVLAAAASVLLARWLGPTTYADYAMLMAILAWLMLLGEGGCNIGLQRYLAEARAAGAGRNLYDVLQLRRWVLVLAVTLLAAVLGPIWAAHVSLPADRWGPLTFGLVGVLAGVMLHAGLAASTLFASFEHAHAITIAHTMTILRAVVLAVVCVYFREPVALVLALLAVACIEALFLQASAIQGFRGKRSPLSCGMANAAQRHGLVGMVDKIATALSGGPFLLLVLAGFHGRAELAIFSVATDTLQRVLTVVLLPFSNLVLPMLNESRTERDRFVRRVAGLSSTLTFGVALAAGGLAAAIPAGLPLLFGDAYAGAVPIALLWLAPLFIETAVRTTCGASLLVLDEHRWLVSCNIGFGVLSLLAAFAVARADILVVVAVMGTVRIAMSVAMVVRAAKLGLLPAEARSLRIVVVAIVALGLSWLLQFVMADTALVWRLLLGLGSYGLTVGMALHLLPLVPERSHEVLRHLAGRYEPLFVRLVPRPRH